MIKIKKILFSDNGFSSIFAAVLLIISLFIFTALFQFYRLNVIASGVRDAVQSAVISAGNDNWANVWNGVRQGYSGAYKTNETDWNAAFTKGDIYGRLDDLLGLGSGHTKITDGGVEYKISGLNVEVTNAVFAPNGTDIEQFEITSKLVLEVPITFMNNVLPPMKINLLVKSKYMAKF